MGKIKIKFLEAGKWGDEPSKPIFEVKAGEEKMVTADFATRAVNAGRAVFVGKAEEASEKNKTGPKKKSETGPVAKAETRFKKRSGG